MNISISEKAAEWYKRELDLQEGDFVRFFVRYGGSSAVQSGFSLGINKDKPVNAAAKAISNGISFFIEENDIWYFDGHNLDISFNEKYDEPVFDYQK
ncbi:hypothetical protein D0469_07440 [Peribacillus saganii]|uniref:Core domain-containing protein n=1 Tax=Peribacillus saganii TaxID=2303992 RepID=A0A372LQB6_9BACI|nr:HesB/YadR/YfhF family protein [Peribacillus saganii]RFU70413.1 hypothetical protein D0469_07440 [Peribacillus saganii]